MKFDVAEVNQLIRQRRSVFPKDYEMGKKVDDSIVRQMIENANWAPTHKFTEPWRFFVFEGKGLKKLAEFQAACYKEITSVDGTFKEERYQNLLAKPMQSSHIIAIGMKRDSQKRIREVEEIGAVFCAIQNMYLTATAYGVGCYLSTGGVTYFEKAKDFFGWDKEDRLLGFLNIGVIKNQPPDSRRKPASEKTTWIN